jgi:hypothetical protein
MVQGGLSHTKLSRVPGYLFFHASSPTYLMVIFERSQKRERKKKDNGGITKDTIRIKGNWIYNVRNGE